MHIESNNFGLDINPATGLPLMDDSYVDVGGNPYGTDMNTWQQSYDPGCCTPFAPNFDMW